MPRPMSVTSASVCSTGWSTPGTLVIRPLRSVPPGAPVRTLGPRPRGGDGSRRAWARPRRPLPTRRSTPPSGAADGHRPPTGREETQEPAGHPKGLERDGPFPDGADARVALRASDGAAMPGTGVPVVFIHG